MTYAITILRVALTVGVLFGFPALAVWARRHGGGPRLRLVTTLSFALVVAFSVLASTQQFGNRLASTGASHTTFGALFLFGCTFGIPLVTASLAVSMLSNDKLPFWAVYAATIGAAAFGWMIGVLGAAWLLPMFL